MRGVFARSAYYWLRPWLMGKNHFSQAYGEGGNDCWCVNVRCVISIRCLHACRYATVMRAGHETVICRCHVGSTSRRYYTAGALTHRGVPCPGARAPGNNFGWGPTTNNNTQPLNERFLAPVFALDRRRHRATEWQSVIGYKWLKWVTRLEWITWETDTFMKISLHCTQLRPIHLLCWFTPICCRGG